MEDCGFFTPFTVTAIVTVVATVTVAAVMLNWPLALPAQMLNATGTGVDARSDEPGVRVTSTIDM